MRATFSQAMEASIDFSSRTSVLVRAVSGADTCSTEPATGAGAGTEIGAGAGWWLRFRRNGGSRGHRSRSAGGMDAVARVGAAGTASPATQGRERGQHVIQAGLIEDVDGLEVVHVKRSFLSRCPAHASPFSAKRSRSSRSFSRGAEMLQPPPATISSRMSEIRSARGGKDRGPLRLSGDDRQSGGCIPGEDVFPVGVGLPHEE